MATREELDIILRMKDEASATAKRVSMSFGGMVSVLQRVGFAAMGVRELAGAAKGLSGALGVDFNARMEQATIGFTTMLGSASLAEKHLRELTEFAKNTPFEQAGLISASQRLQAMGFSAEEVIPTLTAVGDAVAGLGGTNEMIDRVTLALGQMLAKGKVSAEEMNQLTEAGIPAWQMLADSIGVDVPAAMKMAEQGAVDARTAIAGITEGMGARFGGLMEQQARTFQGAMGNITDTMAIFAGEAFEPIFDQLSVLAIAMADALQSDEMQARAAQISESIAKAIVVVRGLLPVFAAIKEAGVGAIGAIGRLVSDNLIPIMVAAVIPVTTLTTRFVALGVVGTRSAAMTAAAWVIGNKALLRGLPILGLLIGYFSMVARRAPEAFALMKIDALEAWDQIKRLGTAFGALGPVIQAALDRDWGGLQEGFQNFMRLLADAGKKSAETEAAIAEWHKKRAEGAFDAKTEVQRVATQMLEVGKTIATTTGASITGWGGVGDAILKASEDIREGFGMIESEPYDDASEAAAGFGIEIEAAGNEASEAAPKFAAVGDILEELSLTATAGLSAFDVSDAIESGLMSMDQLGPKARSAYQSMVREQGAARDRMVEKANEAAAREAEAIARKHARWLDSAETIGRRVVSSVASVEADIVAIHERAGLDREVSAARYAAAVIDIETGLADQIKGLQESIGLHGQRATRFVEDLRRRRGREEEDHEARLTKMKERQAGAKTQAEKDSIQAQMNDQHAAFLLRRKREEEDLNIRSARIQEDFDRRKKQLEEAAEERSAALDQEHERELLAITTHQETALREVLKGTERMSEELERVITDHIGEASSKASPMVQDLASHLENVLRLADRVRERALSHDEVREMQRSVAMPIIPEHQGGGRVAGPLGSPQLVVAHGGETIRGTGMARADAAGRDMGSTVVQVMLDGRVIQEVVARKFKRVAAFGGSNGF